MSGFEDVVLKRSFVPALSGAIEREVRAALTYLPGKTFRQALTAVKYCHSPLYP